MTYQYTEFKVKLSVEEYQRIEEALKDEKIAKMFGITSMLKKPATHTYHCHTKARDVTLTFDRENGSWNYKIGGSIESALMANNSITDILNKSTKTIESKE